MKANTTRKQNAVAQNESNRFEGPLPEKDAYGGYTGCYYFRCSECGVETLDRQRTEEACQC